METDSNDDLKSKEQAFSLLFGSVGYLAIIILLFLAVLISFYAIDIINNDISNKKAEAFGCGTITESPNLPDEQIEAYKHGEVLFKSNCSACHAIGRKLVGPDLANINAKREKEWLYQWIRNNSELRKSGDTDAIAIYEEYNGSPMNLYLQFTNEDIDAILLYIEEKARL
ncbi:MAG: c-type cytochrome [Chitinophagales bacterium]